MNGEAKWERIGAATGILFVALLIVSVFIVPSPPDINASPKDISAFYSDHRTGVLTSAYLGGLAVVAFLWFLGSLVQTLRRAEGEHGRLSTICMAGGIVTAAVALATGGFQTTLAWSSSLHADGGAVSALFLMSAIGLQFIYFAIAVFMAAASIVMIRTGAVSRWIGEAGVVFSILALAGAGTFAASGAFQPNGGVGFAAFLAFAVWMLAVGVRMVMLAMPRRAAVGAAPMTR